MSIAATMASTIRALTGLRDQPDGSDACHGRTKPAEFCEKGLKGHRRHSATRLVLIRAGIRPSRCRRNCP